jgi:hypothetical protein
MTWNYRVFEEKHEQPEPWSSFDIREVYYNEDGEIWAYSDTVSPFGESSEELKEDISMYLEAFKKPALTKDCFAKARASGDKNG